MAWSALLLAGLFEIIWLLGFKHSHGLTHLWPTVVMFASIAFSFALLNLSLKSIPLGTPTPSGPVLERPARPSSASLSSENRPTSPASVARS
jgi:hypothetical protein